jgi:hypothetical protein
MGVSVLKQEESDEGPNKEIVRIDDGGCRGRKMLPGG